MRRKRKRKFGRTRKVFKNWRWRRCFGTSGGIVFDRWLSEAMVQFPPARGPTD